MGKMLTILLAAVMGVVAPAWANQIVQYGPGYIGSDVALSIQLINNDNGAIYNSYDLSLFHSLAVALFALPQNQANYSSIEDLVSDWSGGVLPGEVSDGWSANVGNCNPMSLNNNGIEGAFTEWYATQQNPDQDMMSLILRIPTSQLDGNGNGFSLTDAWDYHITTNSVPTADMGVGYEGVTQYSALGYEYVVVLNGDGKITQYAPDYEANPGTVTIPIEISNNDNGAIYNSYDLSLFNSLVTAIYALPRNQTNFASVEEMTATWQLEILSPAGEVNYGWSTSSGTYNPASIINIGGDIDIDYDVWYAIQQNPDQDMMALNLYIPTSQLDGDGNGFSLSEASDYHITTNSVPTVGMGVGREGVTSYSAQGYEYGVVLNGDGKIVQYGPGYIGSDAEFNIQLVNNDNGAIYNSYDLALFHSLATALFALPQNQSHYASVEAMVADWTIGVVPGEVSDGWNVNAGNYNPISIGHLEGDINDSYAGWYATQQNSSQDTVWIRLSIPLAQLDGNGNGFSLGDAWDYHLTTNSVPTVGMGVGREGVTSYPAQGYEYGVVLNGDGKIVQYEPDYEANPGTVTIPIEISNNDNGAIYNSYDLSLFNSLVAAIYALPRNQTAYATVEEMTATWQLEILSSPVGEVNNKWSADTSSYNPVSITHSGLGYDQWYATQQNPNQDMMAMNLYIPTSQLDGNGNGFSLSDSSDYHITTNSVPTADMGVGRSQSGFTEWSAQGYEYGVMLNDGPEPATGRVLMATMELGLPVLTITNSPSTVTVIVQRCNGIIETNWQSITNLSPGTTNWTDTTATGAWVQLYYRLAK